MGRPVVIDPCKVLIAANIWHFPQGLREGFSTGLEQDLLQERAMFCFGAAVVARCTRL